MNVKKSQNQTWICSHWCYVEIIWSLIRTTMNPNIQKVFRAINSLGWSIPCNKERRIELEHLNFHYLSNVKIFKGLSKASDRYVCNQLPWKFRERESRQVSGHLCFLHQSYIFLTLNPCFTWNEIIFIKWNNFERKQFWEVKAPLDKITGDTCLNMTLVRRRQSYLKTIQHSLD